MAEQSTCRTRSAASRERLARVRGGWVLGLLLIVLLAWLVVRIAAVDIPLPVSSAMTAALLGTLILFFAVIKNLVDDYSTIWSYIGVVLSFGVAYGAWQPEVQEAGGVDTPKNEAGSMRPATIGAAGATAGTTDPRLPETPRLRQRAARLRPTPPPPAAADPSPPPAEAAAPGADSASRGAPDTRRRTSRNARRHDSPRVDGPTGPLRRSRGGGRAGLGRSPGPS